MISIKTILIDGNDKNIVTDNPKPIFSFILESSDNDENLKNSKLSLNNGWSKDNCDPRQTIYDGAALKPLCKYLLTLEVEDSNGNIVKKELEFSTGRLSLPFEARWITDASYEFVEKGVSPKVMTFRRKFKTNKKIKKAFIESTALGVYKITLNGNKIGDTYLAPGFTSYTSNLQYQTYDVTENIKDDNCLIIDVAGGWCVGSFVFTRVNRHYANRQALLLELHIIYEDGSSELIKSDESFEVSLNGNYKLADLYDGETYDATVDLGNIDFHKASFENVSIKPQISADYSSPIKKIKELKPVFIKSVDGLDYYDFMQNFAGVVTLKIKNAKKGDKIVIHHAEVLNEDGTLNLSLLRTAKATLTYICKGGEQTYVPEFTYMGFRYITIEGINKDDVEITAYLLSSADKPLGSFECSNPLLNGLNKNIQYSALSNLMDIPTDCPQRDERMGWTGDISIFAPTASYLFYMDRFLRKWLKDVKTEQLKTGGIPNTVPIHGYKFPATMPKMAVDFWGDCVLNVPYAIYQAYGDKDILVEMYDSMKKYVEACRFWANIWGVGKYRYIWHTPSMLHFGDWVSPDVDKMSTWQKRSKFTATASLAHCSYLLSEIAKILSKEDDYKEYHNLYLKVSDAYQSILMKKDGKLKGNEFQTGYVLPLAFDMLDEKTKKLALEHLVDLIKKNNYCIGTGFPGTPYILFVLADNGYQDVAYKMLLNNSKPSWLYNVTIGGTTIWEKFDGMNPDGTAKKSTDGTDNMISFNHYASGSVGEFLYTRIAGLRILEAGYKKFEVKPVLGGELTYCKASTITPYGEVKINWKIEKNIFEITVSVPFLTTCHLVLPNGEEKELKYGIHTEKISL